MLRPRRIKPKTANAREPRVILVFGPPCVGCTTVIECLRTASEIATVVLPYEEVEALDEKVRRAKSNGAQVIFVDVDGGAFDVEDVQLINDARLVHTGSGAIVRLWTFADDLLERANAATKYAGYLDQAEIKEWQRNVERIEERIRVLSMPYFMVANFDLEAAVKGLALRAGMRK